MVAMLMYPPSFPFADQIEIHRLPQLQARLYGATVAAVALPVEHRPDLTLLLPAILVP
jgi:hypothetical protein